MQFIGFCMPNRSLIAYATVPIYPKGKGKLRDWWLQSGEYLSESRGVREALRWTFTFTLVGFPVNHTYQTHIKRKSLADVSEVGPGMVARERVNREENSKEEAGGGSLRMILFRTQSFKIRPQSKPFPMLP